MSYTFPCCTLALPAPPQVWLVSDAVRGLGGPEEAAALSEMSGLPGVLLVGAEQLISVAAAWPTVAARA